MIVITGGNGQLGRLISDEAEHKFGPGGFRLSVRQPEPDDPRQKRGVEFRAADYDDPVALARSFEGADQLVLISADGMDEDRRRRQNNAVRAARDAQVGHIVFTSSSTVGKAPDLAHVEVNARTEDAIRGTGSDYTILRNNLYAELLLMFVGPAIETGVIRLPAGEGRAAMLGRSDIAKAVVRVLAGAAERNRTFELTGPAAYGHADLARLLSRVAGRQIGYEPSTPEAATSWLSGRLAVPDAYLPFIVDAMREFGEGWLEPVTADFRLIVGQDAAKAVDVWTNALQQSSPTLG